MSYLITILIIRTGFFCVRVAMKHADLLNTSEMVVLNCRRTSEPHFNYPQPLTMLNKKGLVPSKRAKKKTIDVGLPQGNEMNTIQKKTAINLFLPHHKEIR